MSETPLWMKALAAVLSEIIDGPPAEFAFLLNPGDAGLLRSLDKLSAAQASHIPAGGGASIAAHADHLRYGLELLNRWSRGDDAFKDADYGASWRRTTVSEPEWAERRESLRREVYAWREAMQGRAELNEFDLTAITASVAHLAYHLGAIRQIDRSMRGPEARD